MEELIGKRVRAFYWFRGQSLEYEGKVRKVNNNLVFLTDVRTYRNWSVRWDDQVVNTLSAGFVRFEIIAN